MTTANLGPRSFERIRALSDSVTLALVSWFAMPWLTKASRSNAPAPGSWWLVCDKTFCNRFRHRRKNNPCRWRLLAINLYWERHHGTITNGRYFCRVNRCYIQLFYAASDSTILNGLIFKIGTRKWHLILDANFAWQSPFWTASITKSFLCLFIS